jgi:hypothetical protein
MGTRVLASLSFAAMAAMMGGCVSSGNPSVLDQARLDSITLNQSTKDDVKRLLGQPNSVSRQSGNYSPVPSLPPTPGLTNVEVWSYTHMSVDVDGATFIPIVGLFAGGATSHINTYTVVFDDAGIVRHISQTQTQGRSELGSETAPPLSSPGRTTAPTPHIRK